MCGTAVFEYQIQCAHTSGSLVPPKSPSYMNSLDFMYEVWGLNHEFKYMHSHAYEFMSVNLYKYMYVLPVYVCVCV